MTLRTIASTLGQGGSGISDGTLKNLLKEQQGLTFSLVAGALGNTKINIAAIRPEDTLVAVLHLIGAGVAVTDVADLLGSTVISPVVASGTLTLASVVAGDTAVVRGKTYTFRATPSNRAATYEVQLGANDTASAANLAAAINLNETLIIATSALGVVTIKGTVEGTAANAYTIVGGARITASAGTLAGGTVTGGISISSSTASSKVLVAWVNKQ